MFALSVPVAHQDLSQQKSVSKVPLTLMGSKQALNCTAPQNSSRQRNSPAQHSSQSKQEQGKQQRPRRGAGGREQPPHEEQSRGENHEELVHQEHVSLIGSLLCLFTGFPHGNGSKC